MVAVTLSELDTWFNEPGLSLDRMNLLSKLATIELCGWLEEEFDRLIRIVANGRISDTNWVEIDVIDNTFGFVYAKHWRPMLCKVVGEVFARRVEAAMDASYPADIPQLKSLLGQLWKDRCNFAHADLNANRANTQLTFNAPSVAISRYTQLKLILSRYEAVMALVMPPP
ncbi:hypothetical protein EGT07_08075 [Herbaspirillum sp. HC18]|nr:hypothetical protein EGT07_08075 [Herbaspirillum sp. HC18]